MHTRLADTKPLRRLLGHCVRLANFPSRAQSNNVDSSECKQQSVAIVREMSAEASNTPLASLVGTLHVLKPTLKAIARTEPETLVAWNAPR